MSMVKKVRVSSLFLRRLSVSSFMAVNILNHAVESLRVRQDIELEEAEIEKHRLESQLDDLTIIIRHYKHIASLEIDQGIFDRWIAQIAFRFQQPESQPNEYLKRNGYSNIESVHNTMSQFQNDYDKLLRLIAHKRTEFSNTLTHLESINEKYLSLLSSSNLISSKEIDFRQEKGEKGYELLEETIQEKKRILAEYEKHKQTYYFSDKLDAFVANNAFIYISNCEKVRHHCVKERAADVNEFLGKYIEEYDYFLEKKIERSFKQITNIAECHPSQYSEDLEMCFQELSSLKKYALVFDSLRGAEKIEHWHRQFFNYHRFLSNKMEEYKISGRNQELRNLLIIAQALSCLDRFCTVILADNGFRVLYRQYQIDIARGSREAYNRTIDYISKGDYGNADLALSDIVEDPSNSKFLTQIKHDLQYSLNKVVKNTKTCAYWLDETIEREEDNREKIREINENLDKIRIVLNRYYIMKLIDEQTKSILQNFENEINQILSTAIWNGIKNIEIFISGNSFLEAEQCMKNLICVQHKLADNYTSAAVDKKTEELKTRLNTLTSYILQHYDFADISNYPVNSPKNLLAHLKKVASGGYARYNQVYTSLMEKIRVNFSRAIDKVHDCSLNDRSTKIRAVKYAFLFLPEELKMIFQLKIVTF